MRAISEMNSKLAALYHSGRMGEISMEIISTKSIKPGEIPDYSTGNIALDLKLTEELLVANGFSPCYADLTRQDIRIPVVRAIVPGLDIPDALSERQIRHLLNELEEVGVMFLKPDVTSGEQDAAA